LFVYKTHERLLEDSLMRLFALFVLASYMHASDAEAFSKEFKKYFRKYNIRSPLLMTLFKELFTTFPTDLKAK
jgi:hypothetical protein